MAHSNEMRWTSNAPDTQRSSIKITEQWQEELSSMPYLSQKSGKTIHLLKQSSKPTKVGRKRRKVALLGSLEQFKESKKKPMAPGQPPVVHSSLPHNQGPPHSARSDTSQQQQKNVPPMFSRPGGSHQEKGKDHKMSDK